MSSPICNHCNQPIDKVFDAGYGKINEAPHMIYNPVSKCFEGEYHSACVTAMQQREVEPVAASSNRGVIAVAFVIAGIFLAAVGMYVYRWLSESREAAQLEFSSAMDRINHMWNEPSFAAD